MKVTEITKDCTWCEGFRAGGLGQVEDMGRDWGVDMCHRFLLPLSTPGMNPAQRADLRRSVAKDCRAHKLSPAGFREQLESMGTEGWPRPFVPVGRIGEQAEPTARAASCSGCAGYLPADQVMERFGFPAAGCAPRGVLLPVGGQAAVALRCEYNEESFERRYPVGAVDLTAEYAPHITVIDADGTAVAPSIATVDPAAATSDVEVTDEDAARGVRAWRRLADPDGTDNTVLMPIFDPEHFDPEQRAKIPATGDDEHPELYRDHQGLLYKAMVLWLHLGETPALNGVSGTGKGHPVDTKVLAPDGWRRVGDLEVGDEVIGSNGKPTAVTGVFPRGTLPVNRVTMTDGSSVLVDDDHLWHVQTLKQRQWGAGNHKVLSTREIREKGLRAGASYRYSIPMVEPVQFEKVLSTHIPAYSLGVLLANGSLGDGEALYSTLDQHVIDRVESEMIQGERTPNSARRHVMRAPRNFGHPRKNETWKLLQGLGLAGLASAGKFIPTGYLRGTEAERRDLLAALLDCDGSCNGGHSMYHTMSPMLASGVRELVQSLGGTASVSVSKRDGEHVVAVHMPVNPFTTPRKRDAWDSTPHRAPGRRIASIESEGEAEVVCIQVAADDHLYVTEDYIVTHNTEFFRYVAWSMQLPFERFSITASTELDDLQGRFLLENQETRYQYGRIPLAWGRPCVIVIDEPNTGPPEVWQFLRPLTDNSKQLVLDANKGERIERNEFCFMGMAFNPSWDARNVGTHEIADADGSRLMHIFVPPPTADMEKEILLKRCDVDGYKIDAALLNAITKIGTDLRELAGAEALPIQWGTRQQIKVARSSRYFSLQRAYLMAAGDLLDPESRDQLLIVVKSHDPLNVGKAGKVQKNLTPF